jgi:hypothetical protein
MRLIIIIAKNIAPDTTTVVSHGLISRVRKEELGLTEGSHGYEEKNGD